MRADVELLKSIVRRGSRAIEHIVWWKAQELHPTTEAADVRERSAHRLAELHRLLGLDV